MESSCRTIVKLNITNYSLWRIMMKDHLYHKDLYEQIKGDATKLEKMSKQIEENIGYHMLMCKPFNLQSSFQRKFSYTL